ncbi:class IV adenylate cyclase [Candidatus Dojkabacteria bacterium]|nr:class IV adenylate cyclase [Candidatus Dojkabacteria bacterium]
MNKNQIEVELKFEISDVKKLNTWLKKNAKLLFVNHQVDDYYAPAHRNFFDEKYPTEYLRLRQSGDEASITYKKWYSTGKEKEYSHCDEFETKLESKNAMEKIFKVLDVKYLLTIDKTRSAYEYKNFEIELDEVKELGYVCEIEIKGDFKSVDEARRQIMDLAKILGFGEADRGDDLRMGYAYMLAKKKGLLK